MIQKIFVELCVRDIQKNIDFFTEALGFFCERQEDDFATLRHEDASLHLNTESNYKEGHHFFEKIDQQNNGIGVEIGICVDGLDTVYEKVRSHSMARSVTQIETRSWGARDFRLITVDNYYLRITQDKDSS